MSGEPERPQRPVAATVLRRSPGRLRVHVPGATADERWLEALRAHAGVLQVDFHPRTENLLVRFDVAGVDESSLLALLPRCEEREGSQAPAQERGWLSLEREELLEAPLARCMQALCELERYPDWQRYIAGVEVLERDGQDRGTLVRVQADVRGRQLAYVAAYSYPSQQEVAFTAEEGEMGEVSGQWSLRGQGRTGTAAALAVELRPTAHLPLLALPGVLYRQLGDAALRHMLDELREYVEA